MFTVVSAAIAVMVGDSDDSVHLALLSSLLLLLLLVCVVCVLFVFCLFVFLFIVDIVQQYDFFSTMNSECA